LAQWEKELERERSALAHSILGIGIGAIVAAQSGGRLLRLAVTSLTLYASGDGVTFVVNGTRFRKDGSVGKQQDAIRIHFADEK
jgi:hypothetical protein